MTRTLPNVPLWPRFGRSGSSAATPSSSSLVASSGNGSSPGAAGLVARLVAPAEAETDRPPLSHRNLHPRACPASVVAQALQPGEDPPFALVEPGLDVEREDVAAAGGPDAERDRHRVVRFVGDGDRDPAHAELVGTGRRPAVQPDRRLAGRQPLDLDVAPADAAHAEPEDLRHRLLGGPATGHRLGAIADVAALGVGQHPAREARSEAIERGADPGDLDDVDPELGRPLRDEPRWGRDRVSRVGRGHACATRP